MKYTDMSQRAVVGVALFLFLFALVNESFLHLLNQFDGLAVLLTGVTLSVVLFSAPSFRNSLKPRNKDRS